MRNLFPEGVNVAMLNAMNKETMVEHLGIEYTEVSENTITARMPVDHRTHQPFKMLHGGASVALAETLGSVAANMVVHGTDRYCVGLEINANHIKSARTGYVYGTTKPIHIGKNTQVWEITITNEEQQLVCISRLTMAVLDKK
jgi:1,4-dihydroxy-2-naphthoyl-CoA hydrolase